MPRIAYVPPFSGLDPMEKWLDIAPIRQQVGKGQPGSVLRNLLYKVKRDEERGDDWGELASIVKSGSLLKYANLFMIKREMFISKLNIVKMEKSLI